jgi:hypothetical protein
MGSCRAPRTVGAGNLGSIKSSDLLGQATTPIENPRLGLDDLTLTDEVISIKNDHGFGILLSQDSRQK